MAQDDQHAESAAYSTAAALINKREQQRSASRRQTLISRNRPSELVVGPLPTCTLGVQPDLTLATNYQDLWWNAAGGSESGWGINPVHQGNTIVATWYTYDSDGSPKWLVVAASKIGATTYGRDLFHIAGTAVQFRPLPPVGSQGGAKGSIVRNATLQFSDGNMGTFNYTVNGVSQTKAITREGFALPGTPCQ
jgi:hypothetical protein